MVDWFVAGGFASPIMTRWLCVYAEGLGRSGHQGEAIELMEDYRHRAELVGEAASHGEAELVLGMLTKGDAAIAHLERALAIVEPSPYRWHAGRAALELGSALRRASQRDRARDLLRVALDYGERHGAKALAARARDELRLTGARVRSVYISGVEALTPAEDRVARLAADGLSNREIAQQLFLTRKTVEMHMSRCLRKLDISSRSELGSALGADGAGPARSQPRRPARHR
jgi:DNA-binding CsgD family transcriptional regulator